MKNKNTKKNMRYPLVMTGYILFGLLITSVAISTTIPFGIMLFNPRVLHYNVAVTAVALTVGAFLPALLGYIVGDNSVKTKSKLDHHFNGVLFGLLAFWIVTILGGLDILPYELLVTQQNARMILMNTLPSIAVVLITATLAIAHTRSRQAKHDILEYKPFSILLIACVAVYSSWTLITDIVTENIGIFSFMLLMITTVFGLLSYVTLRKSKLTTYSKIVWSAVSLSVLFITMFISFQFVSGVSYYVLPQATMDQQQAVSTSACLFALVGWGVYWTAQVKQLSLKS